jgi:hypothetical protein
VHFEEKALYQVLGFGLVAKHRIRQAKYILPIPVKQNQKGDVVALGYLPAQFFIGERAKLVRSAKPFPEDHLALSRAGSTDALPLNDAIGIGKRHLPSMKEPPPVRDNIQLISMRWKTQTRAEAENIWSLRWYNSALCYAAREAPRWL